ncbi:MAG: hypothetical protein LBR37_03670 [Erysipelotrichaceae bacterium]|jgi:small-conductance mechanosensitive channel|nr:hypothetical protein [Erysipelotrichaceae bacterium]
MSKSFLKKFVYLLILLVVLIFVILNLAGVAAFSWFTPVLAIAVLASGFGLVLVCTAFSKQYLLTTRKIRAFIGGALLLLGILYIIMFFTPLVDYDWAKIFWPVLGVVLVLVLMICLFVSGGKKWDAGDNQKAGYKNYHQRKAEAEKEKDQ